MDTQPIDVVEVPLWFDLTAVFAGALFGAVQARGRKFDVAGVLVLAVVVGLGGGIARDLLLNRLPVAFAKSEYILTAVGAGVVGMVLAERILRANVVYNLIDGIALGVYTMVGVTKAIDASIPYVGAIVIGGIAATAGGIVRDMLVNEVPKTLRPGAPYLTAALLGAALLCGLEVLDVPQQASVPASMTLIIALRLVALGFGWRTPAPEVVSAAVDQAAQQMAPVARQIPATVVQAPVAAAQAPRTLLHRLRGQPALPDEAPDGSKEGPSDYPHAQEDL